MLLWPNQTPSPAEALVSPLWVHEPSVNTVTSWGGRRLGGRQAGFNDLFLGFVKILRFSWISPEDVVLGLKILTSSGGPIAWDVAAFWSSMDVSSLGGFMLS